MLVCQHKGSKQEQESIFSNGGNQTEKAVPVSLVQVYTAGRPISGCHIPHLIQRGGRYLLRNIFWDRAVFLMITGHTLSTLAEQGHIHAAEQKQPV